MQSDNPTTECRVRRRQAGWAAKLVLLLLAVVGFIAMAMIAVGVATYAPNGAGGATHAANAKANGTLQAGSAQVVLDANLQQTYARSCAICHAASGSGAPQTGDSAAWQPRLAVGLPTLLDRTLEGYKTMPPMGLCMDCDRDAFRQLIAYMAQVDASEDCEQ